MPFSPPAARKPIHRRTVECVGYAREDGLWDIEGWMVDTKTYSFANHDRGEIKAGEPLHGMGLRLTIDIDRRIITAEAVTDFSPFHECKDVNPNFAALEGLVIGPGFRKAVQDRVGGALGCTHLVELLGPIGTTAFQTLHKARMEQREKQRASGESPKGVSDSRGLRDSCYALRADGPAMRREFPQAADEDQP